MRNIQLCMMGVLLSFVAAAQADEFYGAELIPRWRSGGALYVEVTNWSKLPLSLERLTAELKLGGGQPCHLSYARRLDLPPTQMARLTLASPNAVRQCLKAQTSGPVAPRALRFVRPSPDAHPTQTGEQLVAPQPDTMTIEASLQVRGRAMRSLSRWRVEAVGQ